ncbi:MAG TPA: hypothetical protein VMV27_09235 [Candidatus Binataceae bacterium]|nr:hypothetical protein [Candidatus Binataceae bacterium]
MKTFALALLLAVSIICFRTIAGAQDEPQDTVADADGHTHKPPPQKGVNRFTTRSSEFTLDNNLLQDFGVDCNLGEVAVGGGGQIGSGGVEGALITRTAPIPTTGIPTGWNIIVANVSGSTLPVTVYAVCYKPPKI